MNKETGCILYSSFGVALRRFSKGSSQAGLRMVLIMDCPSSRNWSWYCQRLISLYIGQVRMGGWKANGDGLGSSKLGFENSRFVKSLPSPDGTIQTPFQSKQMQLTHFIEPETTKYEANWEHSLSKKDFRNDQSRKIAVGTLLCRIEYLGCTFWAATLMSNAIAVVWASLNEYYANLLMDKSSIRSFF